MQSWLCSLLVYVTADTAGFVLLLLCCCRFLIVLCLNYYFVVSELIVFDASMLLILAVIWCDKGCLRDECYSLDFLRIVFLSGLLAKGNTLFWIQGCLHSCCLSQNHIVIFC